MFRLERVSIDGDTIAFEAEPVLRFHAGRRDAVMVGVEYDYRETSPDQERARIRLTAHVDGHSPRTEEAHIHDNPIANDSRRGFLGVPLALAAAGTLRGRFLVEAHYAAGPWRKPADISAEGRHQGEFELHVQ